MDDTLLLSINLTNIVELGQTVRI